ncbi:MAG: HD domain-containing protein [Deltaproteobacteria bacterium]|nr:HD domain-containing protein [Deltaproteobacteria bacterium]
MIPFIDERDALIASLKSECEKARAREQEFKDSRSAMLYLLEDLNETTAEVKKQIRTTASLLAIAEAAAHKTDVEKLMTEVTKAASTALDAQGCLAYLYEKNMDSFRPVGAVGVKKADMPAFLTLNPAMLDGCVKTAFSDAGFVAPSACPCLRPLGFAAFRLIPLRSGTTRLGLLIACYESAKAVPDANVIHGIINQVSMAVEHARMYADAVNRGIELARKIETISVMHEIDRDMLSTLEPSEILKAVMRLISRMVPCDRATVAMVDRERGGFVYHAGFGLDIPYGTFVPFADTSASEVVETGLPQFEEITPDKAGLLRVDKMLADAGFKTNIRLPIVIKGEVSALLSVGAKRRGAFGPDDFSALETIASQIGVALENARLVSDLSALFLSTIKALSKAIDAKSPWTSGHSERVTSYALLIGARMGLPAKDMKTLETAGLLHDIGKLGTYEGILNKPGPLNPEEYAVMKQHPGKGAEILAPIRQLEEVLAPIRHHHENYDGAGYPDGLKGEAIPFLARILAVADTTDAMAADRPYRKGRGMDVIKAELKRCSGAQFDPTVVDAFLKVLEAGDITEAKIGAFLSPPSPL